jgi:hypothetical protein
MENIEIYQQASQSFQQLLGDLLSGFAELNGLLERHRPTPRMFKQLQAYLYNMDFHHQVIRILNHEITEACDIRAVKRSILVYLELFTLQNEGFKLSAEVGEILLPMVECLLSLFMQELNAAKLIVQILRGKEKLILAHIDLFFEHLMRTNQKTRQKVLLKRRPRS